LLRNFVQTVSWLRIWKQCFCSVKRSLQTFNQDLK